MNTTVVTTLHGSDLRQAMLGAEAYMELYRDAANALNVFPVPDGDTGTNMLLTLRAGIDQMNKEADKDTAGEVAESIATGAFWGARGNSGVILSQLLRGFADGVAGSETIETTEAVAAFRSATDSAYRAVSQPREGTMLSVIRGASDATIAANDAGERDVITLWQIAYDGAIEALAHTPEQLPVLKEAGVVDSGGLGVVAIIGGALQHLQGETGPPVNLGLRSVGGIIDPAQTASVSIDSDFLEAHDAEEFGYCTQFVIHGRDLSVDVLRSGLDAIAESTVIIGGGSAVRVHVHTEDPGAALTFGVGYGDLDEVKIDNMSLQNRDWASGHRERARPEEIRPGVSVIAVASGPGLAALFQDAGCAAIVPGGQTLNPSASEIIDAALSAGTTDVIVLPNNSNVILTAAQAADAGADGVALHVVNTRSMPQGTAAMLGFNPEVSVDENLASMGAASNGVETLEITQAVRDSTVDGQDVAEGQFMAILDDQLVCLAEAAETALREGLTYSAVDEDSIITLYLGDGTDSERAAALQEDLESAHPGVEVDVYEGGQPHYPYLVSVE
ncbi:MAG: DAK2 domain-containing protein [Chloroflexi bacterium]|nr:DAK2 domain-containing protein [Chloroflexota bacterium]MYD48526.1 DAK2 domain-containing protein [Chloroflexota bacterium]